MAGAWLSVVQRGMRRIGAALLCVLACMRAAAQPLAATPQFRALDVADGLPSAHVHALAQDRAGYLWIGTGDGLARYDGVELQVYDRASQPSLPSSRVHALHVDAADRVWIGTDDGLGMLERDRRALRRVPLGPPHGPALDAVRAIASTADGALWCGGRGGLYRIDPDGGIRAFRHAAGDPASIGSDDVSALAVDRAGALWVGTAAGLDRWNGRAFEREPLDGGGMPHAGVVGLHADAGGGLWAGTTAGLLRRDAAGRWHRHAMPDGDRDMRSLLRDRSGGLWIGGVHGAALLADDGELHDYSHATRPRDGIGMHAIHAMLQDHEGGVWFASDGGGLRRLVPRWRDFAAWRTGDDADGLRIRALRAVAQGRDRMLWLGAPDGAVERLDTRTGEVAPVLRAGAFGSALSSLHETPDGALWIGRAAGLSRYDPATHGMQHWEAASAIDPLLRGDVDLIIDDGAGGLWLSVRGAGLEHRDRAGHVLQQIAAHAEPVLRLDAIAQLTLGPDGALWLAGADGIARHDPATGRIAYVPGGPRDRVSGLAFDPAGRLWLQRRGAFEQYRWDGRRLHRLRRIGALQGMPAVEAGGLAATADGEIWASSPRGLLRYRADDDGVRRLAMRDGLPGQDFGRRPPLLDAVGRIVAATGDAVVVVDPRRWRALPQAPLRVQRVTVLRGHGEHVFDPARPVQLLPDDRELRIAVRLLAYADPRAHRYRFRVDGVDAGWIEAAHGERTFGALPAGTHRVRIAAHAGDGAWTAPLELHVHVAAPWWQAPAVRLAAAGVAAALVLLAWQRQRRQLARRHARELAEQQRGWGERASAAKSRFLATLGHELRTPMTGVLGMTELLLQSTLDARQRHHAETILHSGALLLRLVDDALDLARIEAGQLRLAPRPFDLHALLGECADVVRPLAAHKPLQIRLAVAPDVPRWVFGDGDRLRQIVLNLAANAVKFTEAGHVEFAVAVDGGRVCIAIRDSGPGLSAEQQQRLFRRFSQADGEITARRYGGSGLGLAISRELVEAMGGAIELHSVPLVGSCFCVHLPLPTAAAPSRPCMPPPMPGASGDLLLIDDDPVAAETIAELLRLRGHRVRHVSHGLAALAELAIAPPTLALLDLDLPGIDGCALAVVLRARQPGLPLVALTARADAAAEPQARAAGCSAFLRKPVVGDVLAATVAGLTAPAASQSNAAMAPRVNMQPCRDAMDLSS